VNNKYTISGAAVMDMTARYRRDIGRGFDPPRCGRYRLPRGLFCSAT